MSKSTPFIEFMLEAILEACKTELINSTNVPNDDPRNDPIKQLDSSLSLIKKDSTLTIQKLARLCSVSDKTIKCERGNYIKIMKLS